MSGKIAEAVEVLEKLFGTPVWRRKNPLDELMLTLLSQNTNDANRDRGYRQLRERFPNWEEVRDADVTDIEDAIRPAGLSKQKSVRMKAILRWVDESFGGLNLEPIKQLSDGDAIEILTSQKGIGVKTAAVMLAFAFDRDLCPVDTHVHRIAQRLGWVAEGVSAEKTFSEIRSQIPEGKAATFHLNLLKFGRTICIARSPKCGECPLWNQCVYAGRKNKTI